MTREKPQPILSNGKTYHAFPAVRKVFGLLIERAPVAVSSEEIKAVLPGGNRTSKEVVRNSISQAKRIPTSTYELRLVKGFGYRAEKKHK